MRTSDVSFGIALCGLAWVTSGCTMTMRLDSSMDESKVVSYRESVSGQATEEEEMPAVRKRVALRPAVRYFENDK